MGNMKLILKGHVEIEEHQGACVPRWWPTRHVNVGKYLMLPYCYCYQVVVQNLFVIQWNFNLDESALFYFVIGRVFTCAWLEMMPSLGITAFVMTFSGNVCGGDGVHRLCQDVEGVHDTGVNDYSGLLVWIAPMKIAYSKIWTDRQTRSPWKMIFISTLTFSFQTSNLLPNLFLSDSSEISCPSTRNLLQGCLLSPILKTWPR